MNKVGLVLCLGSLSLTLLLAALDIIIIVTIYDTIGKKFNDYADVGWLVTGYTLSSALFTLLWGRLAAIFGLKSSLIVSIIVFEIGSLIVAVSNSMGMLIGGRVVAGFGGSGIQSLVFVVATSLVEERNRGTTLSVLSIAYMISNAIGPVIGGAFTEHATWRWCFYINLPIGGFALAMLSLTYNPTGKSFTGTMKHHFGAVKQFEYRLLLTGKLWVKCFNILFFKLDFVGFALSSTGFVVLLLGITFGGTKYAWDSGTTIAYLVVGGCLILLFFTYDFILFPMYAKRFHSNQEIMPLLPWSTVSIMGVFTSSMSNFFCAFASNMQFVYIVQFYQTVHNEGPTHASEHLWAFIVPALVGVVIIGKINSKFGIIKPILVAGAICGVVGSGLLTLLSGTSSIGQTIGYSILPGIAFGCIVQSTMLSAQTQVEKEDPEYERKFIEVTTLNAFVKSLGMSFSGIIGTMIFSTSVKNQIESSTASLPTFTSVEALVLYRSEHYDGTTSPLALILVKSVRDVFYAALGCYALSLIFGVFASNRRLEISAKQADVEQVSTPEDEAAKDDHRSSSTSSTHLNAEPKSDGDPNTPHDISIIRHSFFHKLVEKRSLKAKD